MRTVIPACVVVVCIALHLCAGAATASQQHDPFAPAARKASPPPHGLSQAGRAALIRRKMAERAVQDAQRAARSRRSGFHGLYPGWSVTLISRA